MKSLNECIRDAAAGDTIVPGFNVFGYEDAQAVIRAAERMGSPVLLMVNRDARRVMALEHWGALLGSLSRAASVPVGVHLDHCTEPAALRHAAECGFTSVMYDGSKLPLEENLAVTREIAAFAHARGVCVEAEVGTVPYDDLGETEAHLTAPEDAARMAAESGADWLAVSVGNVHRLATRKVPIAFDRLRDIESACALPLVIHGASGVREGDLAPLRRTRVGKVNIGTALRQTFGEALRRELAAQPNTFDRLALFAEPSRALEEKACACLRALMG